LLGLARLQADPGAVQPGKYDLFIGEVTAAWADARVFSDGHWHFENAGAGWRSLHHIAGGHFYAIGDPLSADSDKQG
jgi:flavin reductase (DIM6/NTAB) family NADH-FMN oxidoreductase RutF